MYVIKDMPPQIDPALIGQLAQVETATIGHVRTFGFMRASIRPLLPATRRAGTAVTLALPGPDSTLLHHAMSLLRAGDMLVIDRCGDTRYACWGGVINQAAKAIGLAAVILDGTITDPHELREQGLPIWHDGISPVTSQPVILGGLMNVPVSCGGVAVLPGDAVLADESGVLVLRPEEVSDMAQFGIARQQREPGIVKRILDGEPVAQVSGASIRLREALAATQAKKAAH
jgi:4-hydroxy-4-methyl-2-oxoglutarate aldolase